MEKETIYGQILGKANHYVAVPASNGGKRIIKDEAMRAYERSFKEQCKVYANRHINVPFTLTVDVYYSSCRYDLDNSLKTLLDCLQYCKAITDDNLCTEIRAKKHIDRRLPRVEFGIMPMQENSF